MEEVERLQQVPEGVRVALRELVQERELPGCLLFVGVLAGEAVGAYVISATLAPVVMLGNYDITSTTASFDIAKKTASVTPAAAGKTYGAADPTFTGALVGFLTADNVTATYSRTAGEMVGAYVISAALAPVAVLGNYDITATTASFDIAKKTASVTPAAAGKTYGAADPTLTGTLRGAAVVVERVDRAHACVSPSGCSWAAIGFSAGDGCSPAFSSQIEMIGTNFANRV